MVSSASVAAVAFVGVDILLLQYFQIFLVFQEESRSLPQSIGGQFPDAQGIQSRCPIQGLRNGGLLEDRLVASQLLDRQRHLGAEPYMGS